MQGGLDMTGFGHLFGCAVLRCVSSRLDTHGALARPKRWDASGLDRGVVISLVPVTHRHWRNKRDDQPLSNPPTWHLFGRGIRQQEGSNACHGSWGRTDAVFSRFQSFTIWPYLRLAFSESRGRLRTGRVPKRLRNGL